MTTAIHILKKYWNHESFRAPQYEIIEAVLKKNDVIALLPTGGGKSICFQIPALLQKGVCIVVSPLIALMQDQVTNLNNRGIKAIALTSGISQDDMIALFDNLQFGNYKFLYLSPERLQSAFIQEKIKQLEVNLIAVDEAHCISEWGHDFRPSYRNIKILKELQPNTNYIALTASATNEVLEDISTSLELKNAQLFKKSFYRDNLAYQLFSIEDKLHRLLQIFTKTKAPAIVYVSSRNKTKEISKFLMVNGFSASYYHGGLSSNEKQEAFENWMSEKTPIMVATNAFGMGIDKDNVKVVVHLDLPNSVENYIQEAGRAGRNGKKSYAVLLQNKSDILTFKEKTATSFPSISEIKEVYKNLHQQYQIANGELITTPFEFNLLEFSNKYNYTYNKLNNTLRILINNGIIELSNNYKKKSTILFLATSSQVIHYAKNNASIQVFVNTILRSYGGLFEQETPINEYWVAKKTKSTVLKVTQVLEQLHTDEIIDYKKANSNSELFFLVPREDHSAINRISKNSTQYIHQKKKKSDALIHFVENINTCRSIQILRYFNEQNVSECGVCDVCLSKKKKVADISTQITDLLKSEALCTSKEICSHISFTDEVVLVNLQQLLAEDIIAINQYNQYYLKKMRDLRIVFMGTPDFAVTILKHLVENNYTIVGVITAADKPAGRGRKLNESAVKKYASSQNLTILQPKNLKSVDFQATLKALNANVQIVVAFRMLPKLVWNMPKYGTFNLHASLLPEYRGAAPIHWAIINGEHKTGVTTFFIDDNIDTGEIILQEECAIRDDETVGELHDTLMHLGATLVLKTVELIKTDSIKASKQPELEEKTAYKLFPETCKIDWSDSLDNIYNKVRGLNPFPAAWTSIHTNGTEYTAKLYKVSKEILLHTDAIGSIITTKKTLKVAVANGYLVIDEIKISGKKKMPVQSLLNGFEFSQDSKMA